MGDYIYQQCLGVGCRVSVTWFKGSAFKGSEVNKQQKNGRCNVEGQRMASCL